MIFYAKQAVRVATQYAPAPLPPWAPKPSRAAEQTQRSSRLLSHADYVPR